MPNYGVIEGDDFGDDLGDDLGDDFGDDMGADEALVLGGPRAPRNGARRPGRGRGRQQRSSWREMQPGHQTQALPFPSGPGGTTTVAANTQATLTARPQRPFQTERFVFASTVSPFFTVEELKIGQDSMFVQSGSIPAEVFSQTGVGVSLHGFIAKPGIDITLICTNQDGTAHPASAAIIGAALV